MILSVDVSIDELVSQGKDYPWKRPSCARCQKPLWGHGYVSRYFNCHPTIVYLKRWRCSACRLVFTTRPKIFWRRFHETISRILESLLIRVRDRKWPPWVTRQRGGHWLKKLNLHARKYLLEQRTKLETILFYQAKNLEIFG